MKILLLIATLKLFYCAETNFGEPGNFNFTDEDFNVTPDITTAPNNVVPTTDFSETIREITTDESNSTFNLRDGLKKGSLYYTVGTLDVGQNQGFLSKLLNVSDKRAFDKLLVLAKTKDVESDARNNSVVIVDSAHIFKNDSHPVEIEPIIQVIDSDITEENDTILEDEKFQPVTDRITISFGNKSTNGTNFHLPTKRSIEHKNDSLDLIPSNLEIKSGKQSDNKKRQLNAKTSNSVAEHESDNFENIHSNNGNGNIPRHLSKENSRESGEAITNRLPKISQPHVPTQPPQHPSENRNFEDSVLTMVPPLENLNTENGLSNNNLNPILTSRSAFVDDDDIIDEPNSAENVQLTPQTSNTNVANILKTLERKVENIADLVKKTCGTPNNEGVSRNKHDNNFVGSKQGLDENIKDPAFVHKVSAAKFPNSEETGKNFLRPNEDTISKTRPNGDDVVGDINQELLSEVDGEKPANKNKLVDPDATKQQPFPSLLSRFGSKKKPFENLISNLDSARNENSGLPDTKINLPQIKDLFPKHKPLLRPFNPSRTAHAFGKKNPFLQSLTGLKRPFDQNRPQDNDNGVIPKERVGDSIDDDSEEEFNDQEVPSTPALNSLDKNPIQNFMKNTLHIPTVDELLKIARLRNREAANNLIKNIKPILPKQDVNRPLVQPKSLWNGDENPIGSSRSGLTPLTNRFNERPLFRNSLFNKNPETGDPNAQNTNSFNEDPLIPKSEVEEPSVPEIGQRFADPDADSEDPSDNGILGSRVSPNPYTNLGRVVLPNHRGMDFSNDPVFFEGTGINLPIKIAKNHDGSYQLSVDADKMCTKCVGNSCNTDNIVASANRAELRDKTHPPKRFNLAERLINRNAENKLLLEPNQIKSRLIERAENYIERQKSILNSKTRNEEKGDSVIFKSPLTINKMEDPNKLFDVPQMKSRFVERAHNLLDHQKNLLEHKTQSLFPRLSQVAKRSPKLLLGSPLLGLSDNSINDKSYESLKDMEDSVEERKKNTENKLGTIDDKKNRMKKRVAIVKNVLTWMKGIGNTAT